jgi:hypothetical protein
VKTVGPGKLGERMTGPFGVVVQVQHANGTLTIRRAAHVLECINLQRVFPFIDLRKVLVTVEIFGKFSLSSVREIF